MDDSPPRDSSTEDPRQGFLRALPRKAVEIKATFGALIADPRSTRMRDELRRRLHAFYTLARSYQLPKLAEEIRACVDILDATRALPSLARPHIDSLAGHIAAFAGAAEQDAGEGAVRPSAPSGTRQDPSRVATTRVSITGAPRPPKHTLPPDGGDVGATPSERVRTAPVPYRTLPPGTTLRKGMTAASGHAAAVHVLFVGGSVRANGLHEALPAEVELLVTRTALDAAQRARDAGPDVIVAEAGGAADGASLVQTLRADPVTEFFPVLLLATGGATVEALRERCPDAADVLPEGADGAALWDAIERFLGGATASTSTYELGDLTLDELTRALQDELRRGIVGAASPRARGARIRLGAGSDVLAATWEAITRIREVVERRSNGTVRFELPAAPRGMPGTQVLTPGGGDEAPAEPGGDDPLPGRKVLVVDDDPAVLATFRALLRDAGAEVHECADGARALALSRRLRPDLLLADIVMPGLDGFALCRAVRRDPSLRHMPVILLSWRDDLLVRMREAGAQAQGYLRKEVGGEAILARVREALRLRERILRRVRELSGAAEVRGRLERAGLYPLLEAAATLGDATVSVSDTSSVTELHLRGGRLVSALRTAHDGSLVRGEAALRPVLGVSSARFAVARAKTAVRENLQGTLQELLTRSARAVLCLEESVSGEALADVHRVEFDREGALAYARTLPGRQRTQLERVVEGEAPAELIARDSAAPSDLEPHLVELVRRGAVRGAYGPAGEDLAARRAAQPEPAAEPSAPALVPAPAPRAPRGGDDDPSDVSLADAVWRELRDSVVDDPARRRAGPGPHPAAAPAAIAPRPSEPPLVTLEPVALPVDDLPPLEMDAAFEPIKTPASPVPARLIAASKPGPDATRKVPAVDARAQTRKLPVASVPPEALASPAPGRGRPGSDEVSAETLEIPDDVIETLQRDADARADASDAGRESPTSVPAIEFELLSGGPDASAPPARPTKPPPTPLASAKPPPTPATSTKPPRATPTRPPPEAPAADASEKPAPETSVSEKPAPEKPPLEKPTLEKPVSEKPAKPPRAAPRRREADGWSMFRRTAALLLGVGGAFAGAYYGVRAYLWSRAPVAQEAPDAAPDEDAAPAAPEPPPEAADVAATAPASDAGFTLPPRAPAALGEYSDAAPWLDGGALPARSGVLVVSPPAAGAAPRVEIDQRDVGVAPLHAVLAEGLHTVRFRDGARWRYQFATVRAGQAVVLQTPQ
ncbi:MAG: response regulator [Polyangiales bacterium]